jgi:cytochrome c oxidase cbb3-type subunit IV
MSPTLYGWVAGITTLASMLAFVGVVAWSFSRRRRVDFESAARLPLEEDCGRTPGAQP